MVIDRIEGAIAVVEDGVGRFRDVPVSEIAGRVRDGAVLVERDGHLEVDEDETERRSKAVVDRARSLFRR